MYKYKLKQGHEDRNIIGGRNLGDGFVESDEPLESVYLEEVKAQPEQPAAPAATPEQQAQPAKPTTTEGNL